MARKRSTAPQSTAPDANLLGLVQACKDEPESDDLRGILADYLEDHDEPERAELVRLGLRVDRPGLARASVAADLVRFVRLRSENDSRLLAPLGKLAGRVQFMRGLLGLRLRVKDLGTSMVARWIEANQPWVETLRLNFASAGDVVQLAEKPSLAAFPDLNLTAFAIDETALRALTHSPWARNLRSLRYRMNRPEYDEQNGWSLDATDQNLALFEPTCQIVGLRRLAIDGTFSVSEVEALARAPFASGLRSLWIRANSFCPEHVRALASAETLAELRTLTLFGDYSADLRVADFAPLVASTTFRGLRALELANVELDDPAVQALARSPASATLEVLSLPQNRLGDAAAWALAESPYLTGLRRLDLSENPYLGAGVGALATAPNLSGLEAIKVTILRNEAANVLLRSEVFPALTDLDLSCSELDDQVLDALLNGPIAPRLRRLRLAGSVNRPSLVERLAFSPALCNLEALEIDAWNIEDRDLAALASSPYLNRLVWLGMRFTGLGIVGLDALSRKPGLHSLVFLRLTNHSFYGDTPERIAALENSPRRARPLYVEMENDDDPRWATFRCPYLVS